MEKENLSGPKVIDLFCGCGGMSHGFIQAGYNVVLGIDSSKDAADTFLLNHKNSQAIVADLFNENPKKISKKSGIGHADIIIGGPPCQGFSIAGKRLISDERNLLYKAFVNFVNYFKPRAFVMENVPNIISMGNGAVKNNIFCDFKSIGYNVSCNVLLASKFGIPQNRKRVFFVGLRNCSIFEFPSPALQNPPTAADAISDLPEYSVDDGTFYSKKPESEYQKIMRKDSDGIYNHKTVEHKERTKEIISLVPDGGNYKDLPKELQNIRKVNIAWTRLNSQKPSFTIDTGHNHHFHYKFNRVPTVRESARIQSFPDNFVFSGRISEQLKQVGNAVPPLLAKLLALHLKKYLNG